ncbi:MAG: hypothetical protein JXR78_17630 [Victivallales bacterium]|nr:hypothetical protein [Victivallales bacterium]
MNDNNNRECEEHISDRDAGKVPGSSGCMKRLGIGCLIVSVVLLLIGVVGGYFFYRSVQNAGGWEAYINKKSAEYLNYIVDAGVKSLPLNKVERESISMPVARLSEKMKSGEISAEKSMELVSNAMHTCLPEVFIVLVFQARQEQMQEKENSEDQLTVNRTAYGLLSEKIKPEALKPFNSIIIDRPELLENMRAEDNPAKNDVRQIKFKDISTTDARLAMDTLKSIADTAAIPLQRHTLDFAPKINALIDAIDTSSVAKTDAGD